ncbi:hypothetical protein EDD15DRAFT_2201918 [Pisolithus albus]|nr:hypothetical protein EDD15DRAFT_2201918 [Pisolithus albus]
MVCHPHLSIHNVKLSITANYPLLQDVLKGEGRIVAGAAYFCTEELNAHSMTQYSIISEGVRGRICNVDEVKVNTVPSYEYHQMIFRLKFLYKIPVTLPKTCSKAEKTSMQKFNVHDPKRGKLKDDTKRRPLRRKVISNMTDSFFPMYPPSRRELRLITLIRYKALPPEGDKFTVHAINTVFNIPACDPFDVPSGYYEHVRRFLWRHHLFMEVEKRTDDLSVAVGLRSRVQRYIACMDAMIGGLFVKARSFEGSDWRSTLFDLYLIVDHHVQGHEYRQGHLWRLNNPDRILETVDVTTLGTLIWLINSRSPAADGCLTGAARPDPIHPTISQCPSATFTGPAQHPHLFIVPPSTPVCPYLYVFIPGTCSGLSSPSEVDENQDINTSLLTCLGLLSLAGPPQALYKAWHFAPCWFMVQNDPELQMFPCAKWTIVIQLRHNDNLQTFRLMHSKQIISVRSLQVRLLPSLCTALLDFAMYLHWFLATAIEVGKYLKNPTTAFWVYPV